MTIVQDREKFKFDVKDAFQKYIQLRVNKQDVIDFKQFTKLEFKYYYPIIIFDLIYTLTGQLINE